MKKLILSVLIGLSATGLWAVPAYPGIIDVLQPDGTTLQIKMTGDEHFHYSTTTDGYLVARNAEGYFEYATVASGEIVPSGMRALNPSQRGSINLDAYRADMLLPQLSDMRAQRVAANGEVPQQRVGQPMIANEGIIILVNFSDLSFSIDEPQAAFDSLLNQNGYSENGATGSVNDYFLASSDSAYNPTFHVYGPYTLSHTMSYYGTDRGNNIDLRAQEMTIEAVQLLNEDKGDEIDFSQYDQDNDGNIDFVFIYYAGNNQAEGGGEETVWPHQSNIQQGSFEGKDNLYDGKKVDRYACTSEFRGTGSTMCGIGTFCHEFSHVLGLPDFYTTTSNTTGNQYKTLGEWDVMDIGPYNNNGRTPPTYSAYERFFMGWLTPTVVKADTTYELPELLNSNSALLISETGEHNLDGANPEPNIFYMLETRVTDENVNVWDQDIPGEGMLITKITYNPYKWQNNTVNNDRSAMGVDIVEADGVGDNWAYRGKKGDIFPTRSLYSSDSIKYFNAFDTYWLDNITFYEDAGVTTFNVIGTSTDVENIFTDGSEAFIAGNTLYGIEAGSELRCIDMTGRTLWTATASADTYTFNMPQGIYCIIISKDGVQQQVLKSVGI